MECTETSDLAATVTTIPAAANTKSLFCPLIFSSFSPYTPLHSIVFLRGSFDTSRHSLLCFTANTRTVPTECMQTVWTSNYFRYAETIAFVSYHPLALSDILPLNLSFLSSNCLSTCFLIPFLRFFVSCWIYSPSFLLFPLFLPLLLLSLPGGWWLSESLGGLAAAPSYTVSLPVHDTYCRQNQR